MAKAIAEPDIQSESSAADAALPTLAAPPNEEIAKLAYSLWEARGGIGGSAEEDWFTAEMELRGR